MSPEPCLPFLAELTELQLQDSAAAGSDGDTIPSARYREAEAMQQ